MSNIFNGEVNYVHCRKVLNYLDHMEAILLQIPLYGSFILQLSNWKAIYFKKFKL